jgi:hypothetical protein
MSGNSHFVHIHGIRPCDPQRCVTLDETGDRNEVRMLAQQVVRTPGRTPHRANQRLFSGHTPNPHTPSATTTGLMVTMANPAAQAGVLSG